MKTFREYLTEADHVVPGNYVCIKSDSLSNFFAQYNIAEPKTGEAPPDADYHCTLMYSKDTKVSPSRIYDSLVRNTTFDKLHLVRISGFDCFDSPPKDGERDSAKSCIVAKLDCPEFHMIHDHLKSFGLVHSYPEFSPHVTLYYNMDVKEAHYYKAVLNSTEMLKGYRIGLQNITSETINTDYV